MASLAACFQLMSEEPREGTMFRSMSVLMTVVVATLVLASNGWAQRRAAPQLLQEAAWPFVTSERCIACHSGLTSRTGEDVSIGFNWRSSMMANSARDPYWQAGVRREVMDHPEAQAAIEDKCSICHMPMARFRAAAAGESGAVFANLTGASADHVEAADGTSCAVCHQILADNFGQPGSFTGGFQFDTTRPLGERAAFGPYEVEDGQVNVMRSASSFIPKSSDHIQESELCATCHTLFTHALNADGEEVGELAEQVPYLEWEHSAYRNARSCQNCHMPELPDSTLIASVLGVPRHGFSQHVFRGGNAFMLGMLNQHRGAQGLVALPVEMDASIRRTLEHLGSSTAHLRLESLELSGHKFPTAYPSRRAWIHLTVRAADGTVVFESGAFRPDGSIAGNDNDTDPLRFEPHYTQIDRPNQVQIYEPIMVDWQDRVTTGLLYGVHYIKDNRLLPRGFDKTTAHDHVAVKGGASADPDFQAAGDRVRYVVDVSGNAGPFTVTAELLYQTIGYRWAQNLAAYEAVETERFVGYYNAMAQGSAVLIAGDSKTVPK
jgi:hypothetical protein